MAYTRRRRRTRHAARHDAAGAANGGRVLLALFVAGAVIYLVSASAAGTWVAQNVMTPVFRAFDDVVAAVTATPIPANSAAPLPAVLPGTDAAQQTQQIEMPALSCFALQMGVFGNAQNAGVQAEQLKAQGAGGYVMEDAGRYRVLAAAYADEASLRQVREQLRAGGMESAAYTLEVPGCLLHVSATAEQAASIQGAFTALYALQTDLAAAALAFDQQQQTPAQGRATVSALQNRLHAASEAFSAVSADGNPVLEAISKCLLDCEGELSKLSANQTESAVAFASGLKYSQLHVAHAYATLAKAISSSHSAFSA